MIWTTVYLPNYYVAKREVLIPSDIWIMFFLVLYIIFKYEFDRVEWYLIIHLSRKPAL